jgi:hypothetical protein
MNAISKVLLATALTLSFAAPSLAQQQGTPESSTLLERNAYLFTPDGRMIKMSVNDATHAMIMKNFKPLRAGTMIYFSGGKAYAAADKRMRGGKMMSQMIYPR